MKTVLALTQRVAQFLCIFLIIFYLSGCTPAPPQEPNDICSIFKEYPNWYWTAKDTKKKWNVPISVQMAIIFQESSFNAKAKPPRGKLLWVIPWKRPSSADGYAQALDATWDLYQNDTGHYGANRNNFKDASDFIGWYGYRANKKAGISSYNAYALYLAYHEGIGNYQRGSYRKKKWLQDVAHKVQARANLYQTQLSRCEGSIQKPWWKIF